MRRGRVTVTWLLGPVTELEQKVAANPLDHQARFDLATALNANGKRSEATQQLLEIVKRDRKASTSYIQRRLQIGYNRAASLMERMEQEGIVAPANHAGKREILVPEEESRF